MKSHVSTDFLNTTSITLVCVLTKDIIVVSMVLKLLTVTSDIWNATDNGQTTLLGLLDLSAAFDTVDHDILLKRLQQSFGFGGTMLDWGTSFFTNRAQTVKFRDISASATQLDQGVRYLRIPCLGHCYSSYTLLTFAT